MRKYLLAAAAAAAVATPAAARDNTGYIGLEAGALFPTKSSLHTDFTNSYYGDGVAFYTGTYTPSFRTKYKTGYDVDLIGGYDFGMFRLEGELGYKRAKHDRYNVTGFGPVDSHGGRTSALSAMINGLVDFGNDDGLNFSAGAGVGYARTKFRFGVDDPDLGTVSGSLSSSKFAWQLIAAARYAVSPNMDVGLKYRYFNAGKIHDTFDDGNGGTVGVSSKFRSHSLLASLIYNFGSVAPPPPMAPPPPPPAPVAPATQTCPDGSVILATSTCPLPPAPPPPPPVERGERGK